MKRERILAIVLALVLLSSCMLVPARAEDTLPKTYEVAVLIDVSSSMIQADPNAISIEAAKAFAYYYPSQAEYFKISVILYNTNIATVIESLDVSKESGMDSYQDRLDEISKLGNGQKYMGLSYRNGYTDIGAALVESEKILAASSAEKKAVILFTDGSIVLEDRTEQERSKKDAYDCADKFAAAGIPLYTAGLNYNGKVDEDFLKKLADTTNAEFQSCTTAGELMDLFQRMYAYFVGGTVHNGGSVQTKPNVESKFNVNIYGQAISEANLVLFSNAVINTFSVVAPDGSLVAKMTKDGKITSADNCIVSQNDYTINLKLLYPADGNWTISFTSETAGTVQIGEIFLYNLAVKQQTSASKITVGDTVQFSANLYNQDKKFNITTPEIYEEAKCTVEVNLNGATKQHAAKLNSGKNGYELALAFDKPGEYEITCRISSKQFEVETTSKLTVLAPELVWVNSTDNCKVGEDFEAIAQLQNPLTGETMALPGYMAGTTAQATVLLNGAEKETVTGQVNADGTIRFVVTTAEAGEHHLAASLTWMSGSMTSKTTAKITVWLPEMTLKLGSADVGIGQKLQISVVVVNPATGETLPFGDYLAGEELTIEIKSGGKVIKTIPVTVGAELSNITAEFVPDGIGDYTISVSGAGFASEAISFEVRPSQISELAALENLKGKVLFGTFQQQIDLKEYFTDSDGDNLVFDVQFEGKGVTCDVDGSVLTVSANGGASGTITVLVSDGRGAEHSAAFQIKIKSSMPGFVVLMVLLALVIVGTPVALIVINKRRIPRMRYRIRLAMNGNQAVFDINKASSNQRAKPVMTVKEILNTTTLATKTDGDMTMAEIERMIQTYCAGVTVTGFAFKEGIQIKTQDGKEKVFMKYMVNLPMKSVEEEEWDVSITFGKTSDFREED